MGYVTQTRVPVKATGSYTDSSSGFRTGLTFGLGDPIQTTTSFRSGGAGSDDDEGSAAFASSHGKLYESLIGEYKRDGNTSWDNGHTFSTECQFILDDPRNSVIRVLGNPLSLSPPERAYWYEGPLVLSPSSGALPWGTFPSYMSSYTNESVDGPKAVRATIPTNPAANLSVGAAEILREGIPHALGATALKARTTLARLHSAGDEYLNVQFGWAPLVRDVKATARAVLEHGKLLKQLERDSGRVVRRKYAWDDDVMSTTTAGSLSLTSSGIPTFVRQAFVAPGAAGTHIITSTRRKWFSGAYVYHLDTGSSTLAKMKAHQQKAEYLLGLELTPEVLWNLAPWSWLSDWVVNVGDNLHNVSAFSSDGLVMKYGYLMVESKVSSLRSLDAPLPLKGGGSIAIPPLHTASVRKQRFRATPYGFGMNPSSFNLRQWTILGALGLTKSTSALRRD
jgi:hypothetical protein